MLLSSCLNILAINYIILFLTSPFLSLPVSHYGSLVAKRLVPVSRVDYQNIILDAQHYYFYCHLVDIVFAAVDKDGKRIFLPRAKESK